MKQQTMKDPERIRQLLADAKAARDFFAEALVQGDLNEVEFKVACENVAKTVIIKAALTSLEVMR